MRHVTVSHVTSPSALLHDQPFGARRHLTRPLSNRRRGAARPAGGRPGSGRRDAEGGRGAEVTPNGALGTTGGGTRNRTATSAGARVTVPIAESGAVASDQTSSAAAVPSILRTSAQPDKHAVKPALAGVSGAVGGTGHHATLAQSTTGNRILKSSRTLTSGWVPEQQH